MEGIATAPLSYRAYAPSSRPKVTIGLPVYNGEAHIGRAIESILDQTFEDFELIISDNGSNDATWDRCQEYAALDDRVRCIRQQQNRGANANFNALFEAAQGEYFKWIGHDDQLEPTFLARCTDVLEKEPQAVLAYCGETFRDEGDNEVFLCNEPYHVDAARPDQRFLQWMRAMVAKADRRSDLVYGVIRSDALRQTRLFTNTLATNKLLVLELASVGPFIYIPEVLVRRTPAPHRTIEERLVRLEPGYARRFPHWGFAYEFMKVAWGLDLGFRHRLSLEMQCVRFFASGKRLRQLVWDVRRTGRSLLRRPAL